jgi:SAM-dependent methyltransferase
VRDPQASLYPETAVGGFSRVDGTIEFYSRVNALLESDMTVLDFGAGRGLFLDEPPSYRRDLQNLRGKVKRVIGVDVDPAVGDNSSLDEAHVIGIRDRLPVADESVDLVVSDHVFEHVDDPDAVVAELDRVLKPGGWICARTPNRHGYIASGARLVPNRVHAKALQKLQPQRQERDVFPTRYLLNTPAQLRRHFGEDRFEVFAYTHNSEPAYFGRSVVAWRAARTVSRILPDRLGATIMVFVRKR